MLNPGHGPRLQAVTIHHAGIELMAAIAGKYRANTGVK
jgi:hypothetical protein